MKNKIRQAFKLLIASLAKIKISDIRKQLYNTLTFGILLMLYILHSILRSIGTSRFWPKRIIVFPSDKINKIYDRLVTIVDTTPKGSIRRIELMELAIRNMKTKKIRSLITIGGMAVGIGTIVFLVSIGYGLQNMVISRVARLEEVKQIDIQPQIGSKVKMNDKTLRDLKKIKNVELILPVIGVVAQVSYKLSVSDMPAYGVIADYLQHSAVKPSVGKIFNSNHITSNELVKKRVLGVMTSGNVNFTIFPNQWVKVYSTPRQTAIVIGHTRRVIGFNKGELSANKHWIKTAVPVWKRETCNTMLSNDCEENKYSIWRDEKGDQRIVNGYLNDENIAITTVQESEIDKDFILGQVLGTASATLISEKKATPSSLINVDLDALIASEAGKAVGVQVKKVSLGTQAYKEAIINRSMLKLLGLTEKKVIGQEFEASFVALGLLTKKDEKIQSNQEKYRVIGVIPDDRPPYFYVPLVDLRSMGIDNFSQIKVVVDDQKNSATVRKSIESMGFSTSSVTDTISQINNLFSSARLVLALLGTVALAVAALGMFNTLTVSLLERTHEVGLMKAMGMKSNEVKDLFLTESMVMGFFGGVTGIVLGYVGGKVLSILLSIFSVIKGVGIINISSIPISFVILILILSLVVGLLTGFYPAWRSKKISALDALRYE